MSKDFMISEIKRLREEKNAVILAHNYQIPEIQDLADFVGDSLGLSQIAGETEAEIIVFCGVHFMAETASIISPQKKVLIPDLEAGCSLASSINADQLVDWKTSHPESVVVSYVNTSAEIKALSDYCITSSNAVKVVESIPKEKKILFLPDKFLGLYAQAVTGREMEIWDGSCHVHEKIGDNIFDNVKGEHPDAEFLIHPECGCSSSCMLKSKMYDDCKNMRIYSTEGMINRVKESDADKFVIATEKGILHRLGKIAPEKSFYPASEEAECEYMKMITIENLYNCLLNEEFEVKVSQEIAQRAQLPIQRMLEIV